MNAEQEILSKIENNIIPIAENLLPKVITLLPTVFLIGNAMVEKAKSVIEDYGEDEIKQIEVIQRFYSLCCYRLEKAHSLSTLGSDRTNKNMFPVHFMMNGKRPLIVSQIHPIRVFSFLETALNQNSEILHFIEEIISYICEYQTLRDKRSWWQKGKSYDPTNLFFEELKIWLISLSHASMDENALEIIQGRIDYLRKIGNSGIFPPGDNRPTREFTISRIHTVFEKKIFPYIGYSIYRTNSREDLKNLKKSVQITIKTATKFLFYIFRGNIETPINFIIDEIKKPDLENYKVIAQTTTGKMLKELIKSTAFATALQDLTLDLDMTNREDLISKSFLGEIGEFNYPIKISTDLILQKWDWYKDDKICQSDEILPIFKKNELIADFLKLHRCIYKMCIFFVICDILFDLAGDGGNLLVYGLAIKKVNAAFDTYKQLLRDMNKLCSNLFSAATNHNRSLMEGSYEPEAESNNSVIKTITKVKDRFEKSILSNTDHEWKKRYDLICDANKNLITHSKQSESLITLIETKIKLTWDPAYLTMIKKRISFLSFLVEKFTSSSSSNEENDINNTSIEENLLESKDRIRLITEDRDKLKEEHGLMKDERNQVQEDLKLMLTQKIPQERRTGFWNGAGAGSITTMVFTLLICLIFRKKIAPLLNPDAAVKVINSNIFKGPG